MENEHSQELQLARDLTDFQNLLDKEAVGQTLETYYEKCPSPFAQTDIDELFKLDKRPQPLGYIREILGLDAADEGKLMALLSDRPHGASQAWQGEGIRVRYLGHACID